MRVVTKGLPLVGKIARKPQKKDTREPPRVSQIPQKGPRLHTIHVWGWAGGGAKGKPNFLCVSSAYTARSRRVRQTRVTGASDACHEIFYCILNTSYEDDMERKDEDAPHETPDIMYPLYIISPGEEVRFPVRELYLSPRRTPPVPYINRL